MIKVIILIIALFLALALGHNLIGYQGSVVIATESTVFEMSLISSLIIALIAVVGTYLIIWLIRNLARFVVGPKKWLGGYSKRQQTRSFYHALNAFMMGDRSLASKYISKTFGGDFHGANYLLAAELADDSKEKQALFAHAATEIDAELAAAVNQAQSLLPVQPKEAIAVLGSLPDKKQKHIAVIRTKLVAFGHLCQWQAVKDLISEHKKLLGDDYIDWAHRATQGEFAEIASKQGANALKEKWETLSKSARKDIANQICFVQLLIDQGLSEDAETKLVDFAGKQPHPAFWGLFKQLNHKEPFAAKRFLESLIKRNPQEAQYYSVLAHLAYNSQDYELANKAISKALEIKHTREDAMLLAAVLEKQQSFERANDLYRKLLS